MLRTDVTGTRPVAVTESTTTITSVTSATQEALNRLSSIAIGKQFQAQIMSRLNDGTFLVRFADTTARMALPEGAKTGDTVSLTLVASSPRPTFVLGDLSDAAEQSIASLLLNTGSTQQVEQTEHVEFLNRTDTNQQLLPSSASASFSSAGRLIDNLLHAAQLDGTSSVLRGKAPILPSSTLDTTTIAQSLQRTLEYSGLFYESHLASWASGNRSLDALMREPQAQAGLHTPDPSAKGSSLIEMLRAIETAQIAHASDNHTPSIQLNNETAQLLTMQLAALEQRRIAWQGELWPGQRFEWEVSEESAGQDEAEQERIWRSTVTFRMPTLGPIAASIQLANGRLQMQVRAASEDTASLLRADGKALADSLDAAGLPLDLLTVSHNEST